MPKTLLKVLLLFVLAVCASAAPAQADFATIERFVGGGHPMALGPDGRLWLLGDRWPAGLEERADALRVALVSTPALYRRTPLTPLADGTLAFVGLNEDRQAQLARVAPSRTPIVTPIAGATDGVRAYAVASDGTVWMDDPCGRAVIRSTPEGRVARLPAPGRGCEREVESDPWLTNAGDGATWLVHLCAGWIVRFPIAGPARRWRIQPNLIFCSVDSAGVPPRRVVVEPTAMGGLRFPSGSIDARGRLHARKIPGLFDRLASTIGPDGRRWYVRAHYEWTPWDAFGWDVRIGAIGATGDVEEQHLPQFAVARDREPVLTSPPSMTPGPDGSVWLTTIQRADSAYATELVRATPAPPLAAPQPGRATVVRVLARRGSTVWLQLDCSARPGMYCSGEARLSAARAAARFAIPGGTLGAVPLRLAPRAMAVLRRYGALTATAIVRANGGASSASSLRLR